MESETRAERAKRQRRESHARWAKRNPRKMRAAQKRWNRSESGKSGLQHKKKVELSRRAALAAMDKPGSYTVLRPDGGTTVLRRHPDGTWEVVK